ncbi:lactonase family protein [Cellulomonas soli]|uniref:lactonase family protein n=1 Tax=Cellulomonas soli TaxID=931535 RepID=UPI003F8372BD
MSTQTTAPNPLWVGTYPVAGAGTPTGLGEGIWRVDLDPATGALGRPRQVVVTPSPSFVLAHPHGAVLYAADESQVGSVTAFAVEPDGTLRPLATVGSGGAYPCHLALDDDARTLYVANYTSGTLGVIPLAPDGTFAPAALDAAGPVQVFGHEGSGPDAERQTSPHAHFAVVAPGGAHVLVVDLGTDELRRYARDADGLLTPDGIAATFPAGAGPRHLVFGTADTTAPAAAYVVGELDGHVHVLTWDCATASGTLVASVPTQAAAPAAGSPTGLQLSRTGPAAGRPETVPSLGAHVTLDGDRLLVGVRGADVLAEHRLAPDDDGPGAALLPRHRTDHALPGSWPRHHAVVAGWTVVAQQVDGGLVVLAADGTVVGHADVPAPTCVTAVPSGA